MQEFMKSPTEEAPHLRDLYQSFKNFNEVYNLLLNQFVVSKQYKKALYLVNVIERKFNKKNINYAITLNRKGEIFRRINRLGEALDLLNKSLVIIELQPKSLIKEKSLYNIKNNLALVYNDQNETDKAIKILNENLIKLKAKNVQSGIISSYANLGSIYKKLKKYKLAIVYYKSAKKYIKKTGLINDKYWVNRVLIKLYILNKDVTLAEKYLQLLKKNNNEKTIDSLLFEELLLTLKKIELFKKVDFIKLKKLTDKSLQVVDKTNLVKTKLNEYPYIAKAFEHLKNYKEAIRIINKRQEIFVKHIEQEKAFSYKQIKESQEIQLQQKEIKQQEKANKKLQAINHNLEQFTAMATHDLKSPLRNIIAFCNLIEDEETTKEEQKEYTSLIKTDTEKMSMLISSLLKYAKIGFNEIEMKTIDLNRLLKGVVKNLNQEIKSKNASVNIKKLPEIQGNAILLQQLFQNLINNALKYNENQKPEITIRSEETKNTIEIIDNGIGIPENKIQDIFKAFTRAHSASKYEGSGVGLATCKKIMDLHSGTIFVSSEVGKGSCFSLIFKVKH